MLAACAMCVRGEFAEVTMACEEQSACWAAAGKDEVTTLVAEISDGDMFLKFANLKHNRNFRLKTPQGGGLGFL